MIPKVFLAVGPFSTLSMLLHSGFPHKITHTGTDPLGIHRLYMALQRNTRKVGTLVVASAPDDALSWKMLTETIPALPNVVVVIRVTTPLRPYLLQFALKASCLFINDVLKSLKDDIEGLEKANVSEIPVIKDTSAELFSSETDLKNEYRKRALECHPDKGGTQEDFIQLQAWYQASLQRLKSTLK